MTPPVSTPVSASLWRVRAVVPCWNRPNDLAALLSDLAALDLGGDAGGAADRIALSVAVVDNASSPPLEPVVAAARAGGLEIELIRLDENRGGSGGFNAGLSFWLSRGIAGDQSELFWLLDSDARVDPRCLVELTRALEADPSLGVAGSTLVDPETGVAFELGGRVCLSTGEYVQPMPEPMPAGPVRVPYVAACSMLVRRHAVERAGPMADLFLNGDDVEWCLRIARETGLGVAAVPGSRALHPRPDRMRTIARYYAARNAMGAIDAATAGLPAWRRRVVRVRRAAREVGRAVGQAMLGRDDLARLHLRGLADAARGVGGAAPADRVGFERFRVLGELPAAVAEAARAPGGGRVVVRRGVLDDAAAVVQELHRVCVDPMGLPAERHASIGTIARRLIVGPPHRVAVVSARGRPADWLLARTIVSVDPSGFAVRRVTRLSRALALTRLLAEGAWRAAALGVMPLPAFARAPLVEPKLGTAAGSPASMGVAVAAHSRGATASIDPTPAATRATLSIVILSYNRWSKLEATLRALQTSAASRGAQVIVADNGSRDGTPEKLRAAFPGVELIALSQNLGVGAFNRAAKRATGELLLILDDDAIPDAGSLAAAMDLLGRRPDLAAVALLPRHPSTGASEWPFAEVEPGDPRLAGVRDRWPVMGCGNLVRRRAWAHVGGYDESFFLYRNDTDLAMKLLSCGWGVHFDPAWVVWHDSPAAARKSRKWFELATRNWVWLCRRHGAGWSGPAMLGLGWAHAHRLAGARVLDHLAVARGAWQGLTRRVPGVAYMDVSGDRRGRALKDLLRLRTAARRTRATPGA